MSHSSSEWSVHLVGHAALERDRRKLRRAGERHLDIAGAVFFQKRKFAARQRPHLAELLVDDAHHRAHLGLALRCIPVARDRATEVEAFHRVGKAAHEIVPAQLSVREDLKAQFLLFCKQAQNLLILQGSQTLRVGSLGPRFQQFGGSQKTSAMIGSV
jgi:hypothetical protein